MQDNGRFEQGNRYGLAAPNPAQPQPSSEQINLDEFAGVLTDFAAIKGTKARG